jgi:serine protease DegQ
MEPPGAEHLAVLTKWKPVFVGGNVEMEENVLTALSDAMAQAVITAGASTVQVDARRGGGASGIVYQPGMVLTANHVVEREEDVHIGLPDGSQVQGRVAGRDSGSDLCLLRLDREMAVPAAQTLGEAQVGQIVLALGRPGKEGIQASLGVVGAVGGPLRSGRGMLERFIRTDAIPYPGFSGGPLVDGDGRIVGINTSGFAPGASLAIPTGHAWQIAESLRQHGRIRRGFLGIRSQEVELPADAEARLGRSQLTGLLLVGVERGQPAEQAGLMVGDILVGMNGHPVTDHDVLLDILAGDLAGKTLPAELLRGGNLARLDVRIGERR